MKAAYVVFGPVQAVAGRVTSPYAGVRYRALLPAAHLGSLGWESGIVAVDRAVDAGWARQALAGADVVVISCPLDADAEILMATARRLGARAVLDVCDNPFAGSRLAGSYARLCRDADRVTAASAALAEVVEVHTGRRALVIPDPVEGPPGVPRAPAADGPLRVLWFGGAMNLDTLPALGPALAPVAVARAVELTLLTVDHPAARGALAALPPGVAGRLLPWEPDALWPALAACDVVLLPSDPGPLKRVKSANRLTEALWAGRWVVAHPLPSFREWAGTAAVAEDLAAALTASLERPQDILERIARGQRRIAAELVPSAAATRWAALFGEVAGIGLTRSALF